MADSFDPATAPRRQLRPQRARHTARRQPRKPWREDPTPLIKLFRWFALAWLFIGLPTAHLIKPAYNDYSQYYYAGIVATQGAWDALYPAPANININPGGNENAIVKPQQRELLGRIFRKWEVKFWFIQPPTAALLLAPLGLFTPIASHWVWLILMLGCVWIVGRQAERILEMCLGRPSPWIRLITPTLAFTPLIFHAIRVSNISLMMAALIGWAALEMFRDRALAGIPIAIGAATKYATIPLTAVALFAGRWRTVVSTLVVMLSICGATLVLAGPGIFREFFTVIAPTLAYSPRSGENQSLQAFVTRVTTNGEVLGRTGLIALRCIQLACAAALAWLTFRARKQITFAPPGFFAACAAWTGWLVLFSPIFWDHYLPYLFPFYGWAFWEALQTRARRILVILMIVFAVFPTPYSIFKFPEPINSHQMISVIMLISLAVVRLRAV